MMELLWKMTVAGTVTALCILLLKQIFKNRLTPKWQLYIWLILAVRLVLPIFPESEISMFNWLPDGSQFVNEERRDSLEAMQTGISGVDLRMESSLAASAENLSVPQVPPVAGNADGDGRALIKEAALPVEKTGLPDRWSPVQWILMIWMVGMFGLAGYFVAVYRRLRGQIADMKTCKEADTAVLLESCMREAGIRSCPELKLGGNTPMLVGLLHPVLLIPDGAVYSREELRCVLLHELCHLRHRDVMISMFAAGLLCIYWFNPLIWVCFFSVRRDMELHCDQSVLHITGERKQYAMVLLKTALRKNQFTFAATAMQNGKSEVEKRIRSIVIYRKPKTWVVISAVLLAIIAGGFCMAGSSEAVKKGNYAQMGPDRAYVVEVPEGWAVVDGGSPDGGGNTPIDLFLTAKDDEGNPIDDVYVEINWGEWDGRQEQPWPKDGTALSLPPNNHTALINERELDGFSGKALLAVIEQDGDTAANAEAYPTGAQKSPVKTTIFQSVYLALDGDQAIPVGEKLDQKPLCVIRAGSKVSESQLLEIAKSLQQASPPNVYQPEVWATGNRDKDVKKLLDQYFQKAVETSRPWMEVKAYRILSLKQVNADENGYPWSNYYPHGVVYKIQYALTPLDAEQADPGSDERLYPEQYAVFVESMIPNGTGGRAVIKLSGFMPIHKAGSGAGTLPERFRTIGGPGLNQLNTAERRLYADQLETYCGTLQGGMQTAWLVGTLPLSEYVKTVDSDRLGEPHRVTVVYALHSEVTGIDPALRTKIRNNGYLLLSLLSDLDLVNFHLTYRSADGTEHTEQIAVTREEAKKVIGLDEGIGEPLSDIFPKLPD